MSSVGFGDGVRVAAGGGDTLGAERCTLMFSLLSNWSSLFVSGRGKRGSSAYSRKRGSSIPPSVSTMPRARTLRLLHPAAAADHCPVDGQEKVLNNQVATRKHARTI